MRSIGCLGFLAAFFFFMLMLGALFAAYRALPALIVACIVYWMAFGIGAVFDFGRGGRRLTASVLSLGAFVLVPSSLYLSVQGFELDRPAQLMVGLVAMLAWY